MQFVIHNRVMLYYFCALALIIMSTRVLEINWPFSIEAVAVFVFSVVGPSLYVQRHVADFQNKPFKNTVRLVALIFSSLVVIRLVIPEADREIWNSVKPYLLPALAIEFVFLIVLEAGVFFYIMRVAFSDLVIEEAVEKIENRTGLPKPVIRLIILEARMWRKLFFKMFGRKGRASAKK